MLVWGPATILVSWVFVDHLGSQFKAVLNWDSQPATLTTANRETRECVHAAKVLGEDVLYVWPYESIIGAAAGKSNPAFTLQAYAAHTPYLEDKTIAKLEEVPAAPVMFFAQSMPIDEIEHITRAPRLFRFLLENYAIAGPRRDAFLMLRRLSGRRANGTKRS